MAIINFQGREYEDITQDKPGSDAGLETLNRVATTPKSSEEEWATLGLDLKNGKPAAHWFVGQVWLGHAPKCVLRVLPKVKTSAYRMYLACIGEQTVSRHLDHTIKIWEDQEAIPLMDKEMGNEITLLVVARYLHLLQQLCNHHLRMTFQKEVANLTGRIRGKPVIGENVRQNTGRGHNERMVCQYQVCSLDILPNQILKAALTRATKFLNCSPGSENSLLWNYASFAAAKLGGVSHKRIRSSDFRQVHCKGLFQPYRETIRWARLVLQALGYDPLADISDRPEPALPPFAIDMNELFERYCEVWLRKEQVFTLWAGYKDNNLVSDSFKVRPDFLAAYEGQKYIIDAKYKKEWHWGKEGKSDVWQIVAYGCHKAVLEELSKLDGKQCSKEIRLVILYPGESQPGRSPGLNPVSSLKCDGTGESELPSDSLRAFENMRLDRVAVLLPGEDAAR